MARIGKRLVRDRISTGCERKTLLDLYGGVPEKSQREAHGMPEPHPPWADITVLTKAGKDWEQRATGALLELLGEKHVCTIGKKGPFQEQKLTDVLAMKKRPRWAIECTVPIEEGLPGQETDALKKTIEKTGDELRWENVRMDLVGLSVRRGNDTAVNAEGKIEKVGPGGPEIGIEIVEIKRSEHAGTAALCEVAWYGWAVAAMLKKNGLDGHVYVRAVASIWTQKGAKSGLESSRGGSKERIEGLMRSEWTTAPMEPLLARIRHFITNEAVTAVETLQDGWREKLDWNIAEHCTRCEWFGPKDWKKDDPRASGCRHEARKSGAVTQIAGLTPVMKKALRESGVRTIEEAARLHPEGDEITRNNHLRRSGARIIERARALSDTKVRHIADRNASAGQRPDAQVHINVHAEWDRSTGLSGGIAWRGISVTGVRDQAGHRLGNHVDEIVSIVEGGDTETQNNALEHWLTTLNTWAREVDFKRTGAGVPSWPVAQVHVWTESIAEHIAEKLRQFDPMRAKGAGRKFVEKALSDRPNSALHIVSKDVESMLAAPIPYRYSLRRVNEMIEREGREQTIESPTLGQEDLDDRVAPRVIQMLIEKAVEVEARKRKRNAGMRLGEIMKARIRAVSRVSAWTRQHAIRTVPGTSPMMELGAVLPRTLEIAPDLGILVEDNLAEQRARIHEGWSSWMRPAQEREATYDCIRTEGTLEGTERQEAIERAGLEDGPDIVAIRMGKHSTEARRHEREPRLVLIPEKAEEIAHKQARRLGVGSKAKVHNEESVGAAYEIDVKLIERNKRWIVAKLPKVTQKFRAWAESLEGGSMREALHGTGHATLETWPSPWRDTGLQNAAERIGRPHMSRTHPIIGDPTSREHNTGEEATTGQLLIWGPNALGRTKEQVGEGDRIESILAGLESKWPLDESQKKAIDALRKQRMSILWGPPGTGKTRTLASAITAKIHATAQRGALIRIAVCGPTWTAIEELMQACAARLKRLNCEIEILTLKRTGTEKDNETMHKVRNALGAKRTRPAIIGATEYQIARMRRSQEKDGEATECIDWIVFDEASQCTVATIVRAIGSLTDSAAVTIAGDPLQMAPVRIRKVNEAHRVMLGSLYAFYAGNPKETGLNQGHHGIAPVRLQRGYRSNESITKCSQNAGYEKVESHFPGRTIVIEEGEGEGEGEKDSTDPWERIADQVIDPTKSVVCIRHNEGKSMQENPFEAKCAATIAQMIAKRMRGMRSEENGEIEIWREADDRSILFSQHLGIVSPHRAQGARIRKELNEELNDDGDNETRKLIDESVDTVERYQGQERTIMIVSFAAGDEYAIKNEEQFLISLNRLNVAVSRARAKAIVIIDETLANYLPEDPERIMDMDYLKHVVDGDKCGEPIECEFEGRSVVVNVQWHEQTEKENTQTLKTGRRMR